MATFDNPDVELEEMRAALLGGKRHGESSPPTPTPTPASRAAAPPAMEPPAVTPLDSPPTVTSAAPDPAAVTDLAVAPDLAPRPSFTGVRPRIAAQTPQAAARPVPVQPVPVQSIDATPNDVDLFDVEPAAPQVDTLNSPTLAELSVMTGMPIEQLRQALAESTPPAASADVGRTDIDELVLTDPASSDIALARADLATQGWRAWLVKLGLPVHKGAAERFSDLMDDVRTVIDRDLGRPIVIGVTSYRGSCGKTSTTVLFSRLLSEIRGETVIALDTDLHGTLLSRAIIEGRESSGPRMTMPTLAGALGADGVAITRSVWDGGDGFVFVPGSRTHKANTVTAEQYDMILGAATQVASFVLVDMSAMSAAGLHQAVLESLDGLVMMSPTGEAEVQTLYETQSDLHHRGVGHLNDNRITVINNTTPVRTAVDTVEFARGLKHRDRRDVMEIPYDRHLATSRTIDLTQLSPPTKVAFTLALAALIDTFEPNN